MLGEFFREYETYTNEELVELYQKTKNDLIIKHLLFVNKKVILSALKKFYLKGQEVEDFKQELYISFSEAVMSYDSNKEACFLTFVNKVINNKCVSSLIKSNRYKNIFYCDSLSLNVSIDEDKTTIQDKLPGNKKLIPDYVVSFEDNFKYCNNILKQIMTDLEYQVWTGFIWGISYKEMSDTLHRSYKAIDNALQRCKKNIKNNIEKYNITFDMLKHYIWYVKFHIEDFSLTA